MRSGASRGPRRHRSPGVVELGGDIGCCLYVRPLSEPPIVIIDVKTHASGPIFRDRLGQRTATNVSYGSPSQIRGSIAASSPASRKSRNQVSRGNTPNRCVSWTE